MPINIDEIKSNIRAISATNRNALYNSHIYWSQKPYNVCDILINAFSEKGDIIYDPFLGSGVTLLEAIKKDNDRIAVGCEINEAPLFIVKTLLKDYDYEKFRKISESFIDAINELLVYYQTDCPKCNSKAIITSVIFDKKTRDANIEIKEIKYRCMCSNRASKAASQLDYKAINIEKETPFITAEKMIPNSKIAVYENQQIRQIFTGRNYFIINEILGIISELEDYKELFKYILMSVLHLCKITDKHSNSQWPLWIPKTNCVEKNIIDIIKKKIKNFKSTIRYLNENYTSNKKYTLLNKGSQHITDEDISDDSIQLIITDPPYLGQVAYSEYMQLYKPFLELDFNLEDEIIVSSAPSRNKTEDVYFDQLNTVFAVCSKKVKKNGYMCMYFHDSNLDVWYKLITMLAKNNFRYLSQVHIKKSNTLKNIISPKKSLNGDAVLFFIKDEFEQPDYEANDPIEEIEANIAHHIRESIRQHGAQSTPELYDEGLMEYLIYSNWLLPLSKKYKTLVEIFEKYLTWDVELSKWKL